MGNATHVIAVNKRALELLSNAEAKMLANISSATRLFEEAGKTE